MKVLFITLYGFESIKERNIYPDLLREFTKAGHHVYVISPIEKREGSATHINNEENATILRLQIGNTQKTNVIEKGINTILLESRLTNAIKKYFSDVKFDLVLYSTPPITLVSPVMFVKRRDGAKTYLLLKDIFPQNAVDIGMMSTTGLKGILYKKFRRKEKELYAISDRIGCMSQANVEYVLKHNPEIDSSSVEVCPNSLDIIDKSVDDATRNSIRNKYGIPLDKKVFVYGGNLGKPQGISYLIECLKKCERINEAYFLIVGDGTEYGNIVEYVKNYNPPNVKLMRRLPREDYDTLVGACDVGLIFLDHRFTIPNFPSRLLAYMQAKLPVLAATDPNTDIGEVIVKGDFGWWCESDDADTFMDLVKTSLTDSYRQKGCNGYQYLRSHFSVKKAYATIIENL